MSGCVDVWVCGCGCVVGVLGVWVLWVGGIPQQRENVRVPSRTMIRRLRSILPKREGGSVEHHQRKVPNFSMRVRMGENRKENGKTQLMNEP